MQKWVRFCGAANLCRKNIRRKKGCNLLPGKKAAKAGWIVFDSGRRGGNRGNLQKCAMPAVQKHSTQAAKSGVIQNPPKFDLRGI